MTSTEAQEKFVDWLTQRLTFAGRGDRDCQSNVEPSGKYWLGRLLPAEAVAETNLGDRGERLEPCAVGMKLKPSPAASWLFHVQVTVYAWLWNKDSATWRKSLPATVEMQVHLESFVRTQQIGEAQLRMALCQVCGKEGLAARLDIEVGRNQHGDSEMTILLVNCSPSKHRDFRDTRLYQCQLAVRGLRTIPFELADLEDSFRYDRAVSAYGINCGVFSAQDVFRTEDAITVDCPRPKYWNVDTELPPLRFSEIMKDPVPLGETLLSALLDWGEQNWATDELSARATSEGWANEMRAAAEKAANDFEEECTRIAEGLKLLRSNVALLKAFCAMNESMLHSANGKYDAWRPFQLGFLLANLSCIVDLRKEPETVDLVWFATGGGKTETYLGLIITAAFYDRLTGKTSGITAWSRFPLRMLSLQQTQRFADVTAAAELVRRRFKLAGDGFSLGFFVGQGATPNQIKEDARPDEPDPDDEQMPSRFQVLETCPFCHQRSIEMAFDRRQWRLVHRCSNASCCSSGDALPIHVVDDEIYRFLPTIVVGTLDKAASIAYQASMRGFVGAPMGKCSREGHGFTYAPRSKRPSGCLVPQCRAPILPLDMEKRKFGPSFRLQDELHLLRDSLGAVDSHYEALYDSLQLELCGRKPKILASSATLTGYQKQVDVLYRRAARVFPVPPPRAGNGFWTADSQDRMRRFVAIAPRGVTIEYTVDRLLTELQVAVRELLRDPVRLSLEIGIEKEFVNELVSLYGTNVVYGNTLRDLEAVVRSMETQVLVEGPINTASLTGKTDFLDVRSTLKRLQAPENEFDERLHIISASSMMSHGVDVDRLNTMVMLGIPLSAAEFIQASARVGRQHQGLIFVVHKIGRERDAGVFRSFRKFIEQGDRFVEAIPVTKRSRRVLKRTLAGLALARLLMVHEPAVGTPLTTVRALKQFVANGGYSTDTECDAMIRTLQLDNALDELMRQELLVWFEELRRNIELPPTDARFPSDLSPTGPAMMSLRDVDKQVPVIGSRV